MEFLPRAPDPDEIIIGDEVDEDGDCVGCGDNINPHEEKSEETKDTHSASDETKQEE